MYRQLEDLGVHWSVRGEGLLSARSTDYKCALKTYPDEWLAKYP